MSNKKVIGIGGCARAGKDTFASILTYKLQQTGKSVKRVAFADPLKTQVDEFLVKNLSITAFTPAPEEKSLIRPMLVWYGDAQRKRTNGRYWIDLAKKTIEETNFDYYIVTDVRYNAYEKDELYFLKNEVNGILCHISKYKMTTEANGTSTVIEKKFVQPANDHEAENDPKIKAAAHHTIEWADEGQMAFEELLFNPALNEHVDKFMDIWIQKF
jgi:hypothetical protein